MLRILVLLLILLCVPVTASASVCNELKNIDSPERCIIHDNYQYCQWEYWFEGYFCTETWRYSYFSCQWEKLDEKCYDSP